MKLVACANIIGNQENPSLTGHAYFYEDEMSGVWIKIQVDGLPQNNSDHLNSFYGLHIHENGNCTLPFDKTGNHYNPQNQPHPFHAGDLPPLLGNDGFAFAFFYTNRFHINDIIGKSIIIHSDPDDFTTQPSGNAGTKIGCGLIMRC